MYFQKPAKNPNKKGSRKNRLPGKQKTFKDRCEKEEGWQPISDEPVSTPPLFERK